MARRLHALGGGQANGLFFAGDLGQRIFQTPFSRKSVGVDVRGRSRTLRINYRTAHQTRTHADRLLGPEVSDVDRLGEDRRGTVSVFDGPAPVAEFEGPGQAVGPQRRSERMFYRVECAGIEHQSGRAFYGFRPQATDLVPEFP